MFESRGNLFVTSLLMFLALFLSGCKNNALQNGVAKTQLSGAAASSQEFKLTLPANTQTLMIQSGASDQVELHLLDADKNPIPACSAATFCHTDFAPAGVYYVQLNGLGQFNNLSLVASWSGPDVATLKNAQPVTGLSGKAGTVILQSLHIPFYIGELNLQTTATGTYSVELLDAYGTTLKNCDSPLQCSHSQTYSGNYFVRITGTTDFSNLNMLASWGGAGEATIQNGVPVTGISGSANSEHFESLYIEQGTQALMLQKLRHDAPVFMEILGASGQSLANCDFSCVLNNPEPGLYYVRSIFIESVNNFSFTAVWGGESGGQLQNGLPLSGLSGSREDVLVKSVYIPENTHALMVQSDIDSEIHLELLNASGDPVRSGSGDNGFTFQHPAPGLYFVRVFIPEDVSDFDLVASWGSNGQGTLQNGIPLTGLSGNEHDARLQSVYIPENTHALMVQSDIDSEIHLELLNASGDPVRSGSGDNGFTFQHPAPGLYFVRVFIPEDVSDFDLIATWGSNGQGTLQNGIPLTGLSGNEHDARLQSVYIPESTHALMVQSDIDSRIHLELLNASGDPVRSGSGSSGFTFQYPAPGLYFVRVFLPEDNSDFDLIATWGSNGQGTLQNGIPLTGLSGNEHDARLQSIYIPENSQALMVQSGFDSNIHLELLNASGDPVRSGSGSNGFTFQYPHPGLYFIRAFLPEDNSDFDLIAAWGSNVQGTLQNGVASDASGDDGDITILSVYIPANTSTLMLQQSDWAASYELLDQHGYTVPTEYAGNNYGRITQHPAEGLYFIRVHHQYGGEPIQMTAAWSADGQGILQNGIPLSMTGNQYDILLSNLYLPDFTTKLTIQTSSSSDVFPVLLDQFGNRINEGHTIENLPAGLYFLQIHLTADNTNLNLTTSWQ